MLDSDRVARVVAPVERCRLGRRPGSTYARMMEADRLGDTDEATTRRMDALYRSMTPAQKLARMAALTELAHSMALAAIREAHPYESPRQHRIRLHSRWLGVEKVRAAFGWGPDDGP